VKKLLLMFFFLVIVAALIGCGNYNKRDRVQTAEASKVRLLRVGHTLSDDSHYGVGLKKFAELVREKSKGTLDIQVLGNSKLGNERDLLEGVSLGTVDMALSSTGPLPSFSKKFMVFDLPFIVQDRAKIYPILDGKIGQDMLDSLGSKGIKGLVFFENGFRHMTNSKRPINKPEDMVGLKIRLMENPAHMETLKALGAIPSPIPFDELFTVLQQKTMDGQENPLLIIKTSRFFEVQKYLALTGHFYSPAVLMINDRIFKSLTQEQQNELMAAAKEAREFERSFIIESEKKLVDELKAAKMEITTPDKALFRKVTESVYKKFEVEIGKELIDQVRGVK
jgi:tripartite ATP-independent transporter DctP family solute receptor